MTWMSTSKDGKYGVGKYQRLQNKLWNRFGVESAQFFIIIIFKSSFHNFKPKRVYEFYPMLHRHDIPKYFIFSLKIKHYRKIPRLIICTYDIELTLKMMIWIKASHKYCWPGSLSQLFVSFLDDPLFASLLLNFW